MLPPLPASLAAVAGVLQVLLAGMHLRMSDRQALGYLESVGASDYWRRRLRGTLYGGSLGRGFTGLVALVGAWWLATGATHQGLVLIGLCVLPVSFSMAVIPILSPEDAPRAATHGVVVALLLAALGAAALSG